MRKARQCLILSESSNLATSRSLQKNTPSAAGTRPLCSAWLSLQSLVTMLPSKRSTGSGLAEVDNIWQREGMSWPSSASLQLEYDSACRHFNAGFAKSASSRQIAMASMVVGETGSEEQLQKAFDSRPRCAQQKWIMKMNKSKQALVTRFLKPVVQNKRYDGMRPC